MSQAKALTRRTSHLFRVIPAKAGMTRGLRPLARAFAPDHQIADFAHIFHGETNTFAAEA